MAFYSIKPLHTDAHDVRAGELHVRIMRYSIYNFKTKEKLGTINEDSIRFLVKNRNCYKGIKQAFHIDRMFIQTINNDDKFMIGADE